MLACPGPLPEGPGWAYEMEWAGARAFVDIGPDVSGGLRVRGPDGEDVTVTYPELHGLHGTVPDVLLDGQIVSLRAGRPRADALAGRAEVRDAARAAGLAATAPVTYLAFDVLRLYGVDLRARPYTERRATLERLPLTGPHWTVAPSFDDGAATMGAARQHGLGGVVAKRLDSPYRAGVRAAEWVAVPLADEREFVVGGFVWAEGSGAGGIGALLVGYHDNMTLRYAGTVDRGFDTAALRDLVLRLAPLRRDTSPFADPVPYSPGRDVVWCDPSVTVWVSFVTWPSGGPLRDAAYRGTGGPASTAARPARMRGE